MSSMCCIKEAVQNEFIETFTTTEEKTTSLYNLFGLFIATKFSLANILEKQMYPRCIVILLKDSTSCYTGLCIISLSALSNVSYAI